jgi:hypothetical protein
MQFWWQETGQAFLCHAPAKGLLSNRRAILLVFLPVRKVADRVTCPVYAPSSALCGRTKIMRGPARLFPRGGLVCPEARLDVAACGRAPIDNAVSKR